LEETVRTLVETHVLVGTPGAYRLAQALPSLQVPATVQAVLATRIDRLPPTEKRLLQLGAVIGKDVPSSSSRPSPNCPRRRCAAVLRTSRPPRSSTRRTSFLISNTLSSTPSPARWPMAACWSHAVVPPTRL